MNLIKTGLLVAATAFVLAGPTSANTLKWGAQTDIGSLDPDSYGSTFNLMVLNHVYEGLVRYNAKLKIEPALAESWERVGPSVWRFHLRKGVRFHEGQPFTADDVIASLRRVTDPTSPLKGNLPAYKDSRKIDDYTVEIDLSSAYPLLLNDLTNIFIFSKPWLVAHNAEMPTDLGKGTTGYATNHANGTGPFKMVERRPDARTIFVANPDWWDKSAHNSNIDRLELIPIVSASTRVSALISGQINFTNSAPLQDLPLLGKAAGVKVLESNELRTVFFAFNMLDRLPGSDTSGKSPFQDKRVRQALYEAINIQPIHKRIMLGLSRNTGALVAPAIPGYAAEQEERLPYNPEEARKLLAEAGYPNGFSFSFVCDNDAYVKEEEICEAVTAMWSQIGLRPQLSLGPRSIQTPKQVKGDFGMTVLGWANEPMLDAYSILVQVLHSPSGTAGVFNFGGWGSKQIDTLIDEAANELDQEKRIGIMKNALKIAHDDVMFIPLHQQPMAWATRTDVTSVVQLPDNKVRLWLDSMAP